MPVNRSRKSNAFSLSDQTYSTLHEIMDSGMADNQSRAIDILANHWRLTNVAFKHGVDLDQMANDRIEEIVEDFRMKATDCLRKAAEVGTSLTASKQEQAMMPKVNYSYQNLLDRCKEKFPETIEQWVTQGNWKDDILATGHSVEKFVEDKLALIVQQPYREKGPSAPPKPSPEKTMLFNISNDTILYWLELKKPTSMAIGAKRFQLAYHIEKAKDLIQGMDDGHREEFMGEIHNRLKADAEARGYDLTPYLLEFQNVYDKSRGIVVEEEERQREEKRLSEKQRGLG